MYVMQMHWFREGELKGKFINFLTILGFDLIPLMKVLKRREPRERRGEGRAMLLERGRDSSRLF